MKKVLAIICLMLMMYSAPGFADELGDALGSMATERVRTSARQMVNAGIETDEVLKMTRLMVQSRFSEQVMLQAHEIVLQTHNVGLPVVPVMNKAYEGMAKQVRAEDIMRAMATIRHRYAYAYRNTEEFTQEKARLRRMGTVIAEGLAAGMEEKDTDAILDRLRDRTRDMQRDQACELATESFTAARDMARLGVTSEDAGNVVTAALQRRYSAVEMRQMRNSFVHQSRITAPHSLAAMFSAQIGKGAGGASLGATDAGDGTGGEGGKSGGSASPGGGSGNGGGAGSGGGRN